MTALSFHVPGVAQPQAEVRPGNVGKSGKRAPSYYGNGKTLKPWRTAITTAARVAAAAHPEHTTGPLFPKHHPVRLDLAFWIPRPPSVSVRARPLPTVKPDVQHLVRAVEDSITKALTVWVDDAQVVTSTQVKRYADDEYLPGVTVNISSVDLESL